MAKSLKAFSSAITVSLAAFSNWPSDIAEKVPMSWSSMTLPPARMAGALTEAG